MFPEKIIIKSLMLVLLLLFTGCGSDKKSIPDEKPVNVKTVKVTTEEVSIPIHTSGKIASTTEIKLSFKTPGIIENIYADEGRSVKKGQLLAKLNLSEINSQVLQAKEGYEKSVRDLKRVKNLYADSVVTLEQLQNVETARDVAESKLKAAKFNQSHSTIYAPSNGRILKRFAEAGELVNAGMPIFIFGASGGWIIRTGITDRDIVKLKLGDSAHVKIDPYPGEIFAASVTEIGEAANPMNGTYEVELSLQKTKYKLASGFVASADIFPSEHKTYFTVPVEAVTEANEMDAFVYTVNISNNTVKKIPVKIAALLDGKIAVSSGLEDVDEIVTSGVEYLNNGTRVNVIKNADRN